MSQTASFLFGFSSLFRYHGKCPKKERFLDRAGDYGKTKQTQTGRDLRESVNERQAGRAKSGARVAAVVQAYELRDRERIH